jgi:hypothetical protein
MAVKPRPTSELRSVRVPIHFTPSQVAAVDAWQHRHGLPNRAKAVRKLLELAFKLDQQNRGSEG